MQSLNNPNIKRNIKDLKDLLTQNEKEFGDRIAFYLKTPTGIYKNITYSEFKEDIDAFGTALLSLGLEENTRVAIIGENRYEWIVSYLTTVCGIGVIVPLDKELSVTDIENLLSQSNASVLIFSGKFREEIKKINPDNINVKHFIDMDLEEDTPNGHLSLKKLIIKGKELLNSGEKKYLECEIDLYSMSILLFTSGTSGTAKGVMLSHKNICSNIVATTSSISINENDSCLSVLPLHHTFECMTLLCFIYTGARISFAEGLKHIPKNLKETSPSFLILVPLIIESMHKKIMDVVHSSKFSLLKFRFGLFISTLLLDLFKIDIRRKLFKPIIDFFGGNLRIIISGAAALNPKVSKNLMALGIVTIQGYGLTETSPIVTFCRENSLKHGSIGVPLPGVEVKIVNPGKDGVGEIAIKGDNVMLGYYQNKSESDKVLVNGWFFSGDLGYMDDDGHFYITGRKKNVIVTKNGKNIYPEELEASLNKSPYILESLVFGEEDEDLGETNIHAKIFPDYAFIKEKFEFNKEQNINEIRKLISNEVKGINKKMPLFKHVKHFTVLEDELPKTTTKKIKRHKAK